MDGDRLRLSANRNCYRLSRVSWALFKLLVFCFIYMQNSNHWTTKGALTRLVIADVRVGVTPKAEKLIVGLKTGQLLLLLLPLMMMMTVGRRVGMNVWTTARSVKTDKWVGTCVVLTARLVQVPHYTVSWHTENKKSQNKLKVCIWLIVKKPSQRYRASVACHMGSPRHRWTCSALTPATQTGTRFTNPRGMEDWVVLGG